MEKSIITSQMEHIYNHSSTDKDIDNNDHNNSMNHIEIWEDLASIKDLVIALAICIITTFSGYILSPKGSYKPLLFGLIGAVIGFVVSSFLIKPKRVLLEEEKEL